VKYVKLFSISYQKPHCRNLVNIYKNPLFKETKITLFAESTTSYLLKDFINKNWHFSLRVVLAEFQTSRSEAHHRRRTNKLSFLESCLANLPSSAKISHNFRNKIRSKILDMTKLLTT